MDTAVEAQRRRILFVPCATKDALHRWVKEFLNVDLPDTRVDPQSTSTPMDVVWEVYEAALRNDREDFGEVLAYASRDSFKTLIASILEVLCIVHLGRSVAHMAAIESQAKKAQSYVKRFFNTPMLRPFVVGDNARTMQFVRYYDETTGENLTKKQYDLLSDTDRSKYVEISHYISIVICSMAGSNSEHVPFFVVDEVDVITNPMAYEEAKMIPSVFDDKLPITLYISTRKFSYGLVQKEIDNAEQSGLQVRHWNIIDVTQRCPSKRHRPDLPMVDVYYSDDLLKTVDSETYEGMSPSLKDKFKKDRAYSGCTSNCKMFAMCRGRLATEQRPNDPKAKVKSYLKPISHVQRLFGKVSLSTAQAQLMSRKAEEKGVIYPTFDPEVHVVSASTMANMMTGDAFPESFTKAQLLALLKERGVKFSTGMDFGYTHNWAAVTAAIDGQRCFVVDVMTVPELQVSQQILLCNERILHLDPKVHADPENPQAIIDFRKAGYKISAVTKGRGSVLGGIDVVRTLLRPGIGDPRLFILKDDPDGGCEYLKSMIRSYHWKLDAVGNPTSEPDDESDDEVDALRYLVMANFSSKVKIAPQPVPGEQTREVQPARSVNWERIMGEVQGSAPLAVTEMKGKKGRFFFDI